MNIKVKYIFTLYAQYKGQKVNPTYYYNEKEVINKKIELQNLSFTKVYIKKRKY